MSLRTFLSSVLALTIAFIFVNGFPTASEWYCAMIEGLTFVAGFTEAGFAEESFTEAGLAELGLTGSVASLTEPGRGLAEPGPGLAGGGIVRSCGNNCFASM